MNSSSHYLEVSAIIADNIVGRPVVKYQLAGKNKCTEIDFNNPIQEPLMYPLLHTHGELGWSSKIAKQLPFAKYIASRIFMPEKTQSNGILQVLNKNGTRLLPTNRYQMLSRLGQMYIVDQLSRHIDHQLDWNYKNQDKFHASTRTTAVNEQIDDSDSDTDSDTEEGDDNDNTQQKKKGGKSFLSDHHHGSLRHRRKMARNALTIVSERKRPTLFITLTCNPNWPEIVDALLPGQTAFDRPDVTCPVFRARLYAFLHNLRQGKYFGKNHPVTYEMMAIEYQVCTLFILFKLFI
jgi:hypothetical protein